MAQYDRRQSFFELFQPPQGYHTDFVGMTTFTLSLRLLAWIPAFLVYGEKRIPLPRGLGTAIHRMGYEEACNKFRIYYDGKTKAAVDQPSFYGTAAGRLAQQLLATRCTPVNPDGGLFHPKILLFQFSDKDNRKFFRVHISSRNLTMGKMLEAGVTLETTPDGPADTAAAGKLADFWELLPRAEETESPALDLTALRKTTLKLCDGDARVDCTLHFGGLDKLGSSGDATLLERMRQDREQYARLRVISMNPKFPLFGKDETVEYVCNFPDLYDPPKKGTTWKRKENLPETAFVCEGTDKNQTCRTRPRSLHIKEYLFSGGNQKEDAVWIGSANCSDNALNGKNVEVMVRYQVKQCPVPPFQEGGFCEDPKLKFCMAPSVSNPQLPPDPADRFLNVRVEGKAIETIDKNGPSWTLTVTLHNGEDFPVDVWLPRGEKQKLKAGASEEKRFSIDRPSRYSLVLLLQKHEEDTDEDTVYMLPLNLDWDSEAGSRKDLICKVPLDPMESVKEMIPVVKGQNTATDEAYERLAKLAVFCPETCTEIFRDILSQCRERLEELERYGIDSKKDKKTLLDEVQQKMKQVSAETEADWRAIWSTVVFLEDIRTLAGILEHWTKEGEQNHG